MLNKNRLLESIDTSIILQELFIEWEEDIIRHTKDILEQDEDLTDLEYQQYWDARQKAKENKRDFEQQLKGIMITRDLIDTMGVL